jgi:hypothetical protein
VRLPCVELAQARDMRSVPPCTMGDPVAACGTADNGRPVLCHAGQWCHPNRACTNLWFADPRELHSCSEKVYTNTTGAENAA